MVKTLAGKIEMIISLHDRGLFCKCEDWRVIHEDEYTYDTQLIHEENCEAKEKIKELLND